ncbi:type IV pili twitching motility protein PilT, partial [Candidatus Gracilibacteria bacterium]|nr:type IV pili twitching motility protein PilT [Candidatus Gracilibacteria bacterium]
VANDAVKNLIIQGKTHQLYSVLEVSLKDGMVLMDKYLATLHKKGLITKDTLMSYVRDKDSVDMLMK